jgi:hypothetical protein
LQDRSGAKMEESAVKRRSQIRRKNSTSAKNFIEPSTYFTKFCSTNSKLDIRQFVHDLHVHFVIVLLFERPWAQIARKLRFLSADPLDVFVKRAFVLVAIFTRRTLVRAFQR